jgi:spermidine synthase
LPRSGHNHASADKPTRGTAFLFAVTACFFFSGFAALLYQTAWLRQFSLVFGTSELAVAAVLAAYMGGLAAGAATIERYVRRVRRPVLVYGSLEAGIAVSALAVPVLLAAARAFYVWLLGSQPVPPDAAAIGQPAFYLAVAFLVLALPTGLMGATLPLLTRYAVTTDREVGPRVALLYAVNTAGAVAGTLTAGFLLLPTLGLNGTVWVGVGLNAFVFGIAISLSRALPPAVSPREDAGRPVARALIGFSSACVAPLFRRSAKLRERISSVYREQAAWMLPLMLVSGADAFLYEVLWTRMLAHVIGSSIYAFATMLAAFLGGIALGAALAGRIAARRSLTASAFAATQIAIAALSIGIYSWMGALLPEGEQTGPLAAYAIFVMLPATVFIGATFPLAVRLLTRDEREASAVTARVYAWNTVGAIVGAILGGFFVIPSLGFEGTIKLAVSVNLLLALWTAAFVAKPRPAYVAAAAASLLLALGLYRPARPQAVLARTGFIPDVLEAPTELYYAVGRSATVMLLEEGGHYYLRTNGLPEASIVAKGGLPSGDPTRWLGAIPVLARPDTSSMLVIGYGGGVALEGVPKSVQSIDSIEIESEVMNANRALSGKRDYDPLADPRVHIVINDARNALRLTDKTYDAIVSQPSHPWTAGASHLFTREFLAETKRHLAAGGVFIQWMNAEFVDEPLLKSLAATLLAEFANVRLYEPAARFLVFVACDEALDPEVALARSGRPLTADVMHYSRMGVNSVEDLLAALVTDEAGLARFAADAPLSTDDTNLMATDSRPRADGLDARQLAQLFAPYDPLLDAGSWIYTELGASLNFGYLADRLIRAGELARASQVAAMAPDESTRLLIRALVLEADGKGRDAAQTFLAAVRANPGNAQARFHLLERLRASSEDANSPRVQALISALPPAAAAVFQGWTYQADKDWPSLAKLDPELGRSRVTDAWYPQAARLRAQWRLNVAQNRKQYAYDALRLIDRALLLQPESDLYVLRTISAVILGDSDLIVESCGYVTQSADLAWRAAQKGTPMSPRDLAAMRQNLATVVRQLETNLVDRNALRTQEVLRDTERLISTIDEATAPQ